MSRLNFVCRPWVYFDAFNKDHRKWFAEFQQSGTWGRCPVRFALTEDHGDLVNMIRTKLIDYYAQKEFKFAK